MSKIRIGFSTDFNLVNEQVGIGTTNPESRLNVPGQILADNTAGSGGVSTYREYQGFYQTQSNVSHKVTIDATTAGNLNSLSGELRIDGDVTIAPDTSVTSGKIDSLTATDKFAVPLGETNNRENTPEAGTTRFNQDFGTLEFFDGVDWKTVNSYARYGAAGRALTSGGGTTASQYLDSLNINTLETLLILETCPKIEMNPAGFGDGIRGVFGGGSVPAAVRTIDYNTIASEGNSIDFGDRTDVWKFCRCSMLVQLVELHHHLGGWGPGTPRSSNTDVIDYVEISTVGDALDFGDLKPRDHMEFQLAQSPTRGIFAGGWTLLIHQLLVHSTEFMDLLLHQKEIP